VFHVTLGEASATPVSGRLFVFAHLITPSDGEAPRFSGETAHHTGN